MTPIDRRALLKGAAAAAIGGALTTGLADGASAEIDDEVSRSRSATPGGRDFPKVGGNYGNQNYTSLGAIHHGNIHRARRCLA